MIILNISKILQMKSTLVIEKRLFSTFFPLSLLCLPFELVLTYQLSEASEPWSRSPQAVASGPPHRVGLTTQQGAGSCGHHHFRSFQKCVLFSRMLGFLYVDKCLDA